MAVSEGHSDIFQELARKEHKRRQRQAFALSLAVAYGKWQGITQERDGSIPPFRQAFYGIFILIAAAVLIDEESYEAFQELFQEIRKAIK